MYLVNHSDIPDSVLLPLIRQVQADFNYSHRTVLYVHTEYNHKQRGMHGLAYKYAPAPFDRFKKDGMESLIVLSIAQSVCYPYSTQYVREVPSVTINSFEEEFVLVLAHELRHIDQFHEGLNVPAFRYASEVDAEKHAVASLYRHRSGFKQQRAA